MKTYQKSIFILFVLFQFAAIAQNAYSVESSSIKFAIKNAGLTVNGTFAGFKSTIIFDGTNLSTATFDAQVEVKTIETGIGLRNNHLKKAVYFDAEKYPIISMKATRVEKKESGFLGYFSITIKGTTKLVEIPFTFDGNRFKAVFSINRLDFKVGGSNVVMADDVTVLLDILVKK